MVYGLGRREYGFIVGSDNLGHGRKKCGGIEEGEVE